MDCSRADDLMEPKVPEFGVPGRASPESRDWRQEVSPTWVSPWELANLAMATMATLTVVALL
ncbi:hypothetical protein D3C74_475790 [compost metagenome]